MIRTGRSTDVPRVRSAGGSFSARRASRAASTAAVGTPARRAASSRLSLPRSTSSRRLRSTPRCPLVPLVAGMLPTSSICWREIGGVRAGILHTPSASTTTPGPRQGVSVVLRGTLQIEDLAQPRYQRGETMLDDTAHDVEPNGTVHVNQD